MGPRKDTTRDASGGGVLRVNKRYRSLRLDLVVDNDTNDGERFERERNLGKTPNPRGNPAPAEREG